MKNINAFPNPEQLNLPSEVTAALLKHLQHPFPTIAEAIAYWQSSGTKLVISAPPESVILEYTDSLPDGYSISLVITSDAGEGVYYLTPPTQN